MPPTIIQAPRRSFPVWQAILIVLAGLFVYAPVFQGGWLFDDNVELTENHVVQDPAGLPRIWRGESGADYLPLKTTVQWLLWRVFGNDPAPFHAVNVSLHLLSAFLFWRLLWRLGTRHAWLGGVLFAVHPIFVGSAAWVSELKNTLSLVFLLATMLAWLDFDEGRHRKSYAWSLAGFVAALLCKASVIMWPVVILLHAWWRRGRVTRRDMVESAPFFVVSLAAAVTTVVLQSRRAIGTEVYPVGGVAAHLALAGMDAMFYLWKIVLPAGLLPMYPRWQVDPPGVATFLPVVLLAVLCGWLWTKRHSVWGGTVLFGFGFFLVNLFPVLGFFRMSYMRIAWVADHLVYVPSLGVIGLAAAGLGWEYDRLEKVGRSRLRTAGWVSLAVLVIASRVHAEAYANVETLSRYTIASNPDAWLAHQLLASSAGRRGDMDTALEQACEAVRLRPDEVTAQNSLGLAYQGKGRFQEAIVYLSEAVRLAQASHLELAGWDIRENLARCLAAAGQYDRALQEYSPLLQHSPRKAILHTDAGVCLLGQKRCREAADEFREALAIEPAQTQAQRGLALALSSQQKGLR